MEARIESNKTPGANNSLDEILEEVEAGQVNDELKDLDISVGNLDEQPVDVRSPSEVKEQLKMETDRMLSELENKPKPTKAKEPAPATVEVKKPKREKAPKPIITLEGVKDIEKQLGL